MNCYNVAAETTMPSIFNQAIFPSVIIFKCRDLLQNEISVKEAKITKIDHDHKEERLHLHVSTFKTKFLYISY